MSDNLCRWHANGKPAWAPTRFFQAECTVCEKKADEGKCARTDPTPGEVTEALGKTHVHNLRNMKPDQRKKRRWEIEARARRRQWER